MFGLAATSEKNSYPLVLQKLLGDNFSVNNFVTRGAIVINDYEWSPERYSPYENPQNSGWRGKR